MADLTAPLPSGASGTTERFRVGVSTWTRPDLRRLLQLGLATIWLLDGLLQLQSFFFTSQFGKTMIAPTAAGNPDVIKRPITWSASYIAHHPDWTNALFASIQLLLGLAIAWGPTLKAGLAASIVWSLGVWWIGEGLGGVLSGAANPVNGAPGAVIIYALLAVLLWPSGRTTERVPFEAARTVGAAAAKALWLVLWGSLAYFALAGPNRAAGALHDLISGEANGEPGWIASMDSGVARVVDHGGLGVMIVLAVVLAIVAVGAYLPDRLANGTIVVALVVAALIWVVGENFGALFTSGATDVNSGPLLALLALAYWRTTRIAPTAGTWPETVAGGGIR